MIGLRLTKIFATLLIFTAVGSAHATDWQKIIDKNKNSLITVRFYAPFKLDNESIGTFFATGVIVDKAKGLVLVDRETAQVSPSVITGYLQNYEEIDLKIVYYDPIHNFAFMRFDPERVGWKELGQVDIGDSGSVKMGDEIILLTTKKNKNFAAVKGNIVDVRLPKDRNKYRYQDYNASYFDASLVSINEGGGIIIDKKGKAVALHAWIHEKNPYDSNEDKHFFAELPINFVKKTLESLRNDSFPKRGDLGLVLNFMTFKEAADFGVPPETIRNIRRNPGLKGMLYVSRVAGGTPNQNTFKPGDIIVSVDSYYIGDNYMRYEKILDENTGKDIFVTIYREGKPQSFEVKVFDLSKTKTQKFVLFSGGVFQDIPWFIKVRTGIAQRGVYVSNYYGGSPLACSNFFENNVITDINGHEIQNIDDFHALIEGTKDDDLIIVRYIDLILNNRESIRSFRINKRFYPTRLFVKGKHDGDWEEMIH